MSDDQLVGVRPGSVTIPPGFGTPSDRSSRGTVLRFDLDKQRDERSGPERSQVHLPGPVTFPDAWRAAERFASDSNTRRAMEHESG